ncbi:MAG TPA: porin [Candidatus Dormibacteraeota bacterium]|nr:porin [Candidatus Dormibacteraeota bacterium]
MRNQGIISRVVIGLFCVAMLLPGSARAQSSCEGNAEVTRLLELLVQKHLLTRQEAESVRAEAEAPGHLATATPPAPQPAGVKLPESDSQTAPQATSPEAPRATASASLRERAQEVVAKLPVKISGHGQVEWTSLPGTNSTFEVRRARLNVSGHFGQLATYKIGLETLDSPALRDAYLRLNVLPQARLTAGEFKIPFSQESLRSSRNLWMVERSQVVNRLVPGRDNKSGGRDIGAEVGGAYNFSPSTGIDYAIGVFNGAGINRKDDNHRKDLALRLAIRPLKGLAFAGDYYNGASGASEVPRDRQDVEFAYTRHSLTLRSEFIWGRDGAVHEQGWYGLGGWRFTKKWQGLFRVDGYNPNRSQTGQGTTTYLGGVNWYFAPGLRLQLNYGLENEQNSLKDLGLSQLQFEF